MESQTHRTAATAALEQTRGRGVPQAAQPESSLSARLRRVLDYQASSLAKDDPLEANLGSINGGLMRVALALEETIKHAMKSGPPNVEQLARILPANDSLARDPPSGSLRAV